MGVEHPQIVGEAEPVEQQKEAVKAGERRNAHAEHARQRQRAAPQGQPRRRAGVFPPPDGESPRQRAQYPEAGTQRHPIDAPHQPFDIAHMGNLAGVENILLQPVHGNPDGQGFRSGVKVAAQRGPDGQQVGFGDAGTGRRVVTLKPVAVEAGVVHRPGHGAGYQQQQQRRRG